MDVDGRRRAWCEWAFIPQPWFQQYSTSEQDATDLFLYVSSLHSSKTGFLLSALEQQLAKISSCSLAHSVCNLGFIFNTHLTFSDQISAYCKSCYSQIVTFAASVHILISKSCTPAGLLQLTLQHLPAAELLAF